jgi:hypothetical protein
MFNPAAQVCERGAERGDVVHNKNTSPSRNLAYKGGLPKYPSDRIGSSV